MTQIRAGLTSALMMLALAATTFAHADPSDDALKAARRGDFATASRIWIPLAKQGNARAQFDLGVMYQHGQGVPQDYKQALKWYQLAAAHGDEDAQNNLGGFYDQGFGVPQNFAEARKWYGLAATHGNADAMNNIGVLYIRGHGVPQDNVRAYMWESLAAAHGNLEAPKNLDRFGNRINPAQIGKAKSMAAKCAASHYAQCD